MLLKLFSGKKTYLIGVAMVLSGLLSALMPEAAMALNIVVDNPGEMAMQGLAIIFLRQGVAKGAP